MKDFKKEHSWDGVGSTHRVLDISFHSGHPSSIIYSELKGLQEIV
jgi:hypothetical protein